MPDPLKCFVADTSVAILRPNAFVSVNDGEFSARGRAGGQMFMKSGLDIDAHTGEEGMTRGMKRVF